MQNTPPVVRQYQKHIPDLEADGRHRKKVDGNHGLHVVVQEGPPGLGGRIVTAHQVLAHAGLADVNAQFEKLAVNPWSAPEWVFTTHGANQLAHLFRYGRPPRLTVSDLPGPEQAKALPVPADDGRGFDDQHAGLPIVPDCAQPSPEQSIRRGQFGSLDGALQKAEWMAKGEDLELKGRTAPKGGAKCGQESGQ